MVFVPATNRISGFEVFYPVRWLSLRNLVQLCASIELMVWLKISQLKSDLRSCLKQVSSLIGGVRPPRPSPWIRHCGHKPLDTAMGASLKEGYDACSCLLWNWWKKKARIYTFKIPVSFSTFSLSLVDDIAVKTELQFSVVWKRTWPCKQDIKQNGYYFVSIPNIQ